MLNLGYFKGQPTEYVFRYAGGRLVREGRGLAFFYARHNTQVVAVPTSSTDAAFVFNEITSNFQEVTLQGQLTYRIRDPKRAAELLNFTLNPATRTYLSDDPDRLPQRISIIVQTATRAEIQGQTLEDVLGQYERIAEAVDRRVRESGALEPLGVELLSVFFTSARPTPEVGRALEASYRETLLRRADEAVSARRAAAVEDERKIKENELNTDIAIEQQRAALLALQGTNARAEAESQGQAQSIRDAYATDSRQKLLDLYRALDPRFLTALAMHEMGENADRIGQLTITPEILASLLNRSGGGGDGAESS